MKQYETPTEAIVVEGQELMLQAADRIVVAARNKGVTVTWEGAALSIEGDAVSWRMTAEETAALRGLSEVELTAFIGEDVYKTDTQVMRIEEAVWPNE